MKLESFFNVLKNRWQIESSLQIFVILIVFACTGFTALYVKKIMFAVLGITSEDTFLVRIIAWLLTVLPAYHLLLLVYGYIFGQGAFFLKFSKKMLNRFVPSKQKT